MAGFLWANSVGVRRDEESDGSKYDGEKHDGVMTCNCFLLYWPFVEGIQRWAKEPARQSFGLSFVASRKKTLDMQVIYGALALMQWHCKSLVW